MILEISKSSGANIINTVVEVKEMIKENSQEQSDQINEMIADLENRIILAGILLLSSIWASPSI